MTQQEHNDRLDEQKELRKLIVQTLNTVNGLESSVRKVSAKVLERDRTESSRSMALTIGMGVVIILAFFFYFKAEDSHLQEKIGTLNKQIEGYQKDVREYKEKLATVENTDIKAYNLYLAFKEGNPDEALKMYSSFNLSTLSRLERLIIETEVNLIKQRSALRKYDEGMDLFNRKSYLAAVEKFNESLQISPTGKHVPSLFYTMAAALYRSKDFNKAAIAFERFLFSNTEKGVNKDKAELLLGICYEQMKQQDRALAFYDQVLKENKYSRFRPTIKERMKVLEKWLERQRQQEEKKPL